MMVAMRNLYLVEGPASVCGTIGIDIHYVRRVRVLRIGNDVHVIPRPLNQTVASVHHLPGLTAVIRAIQSSLICLDERVYPLRIRRDRYTNTPVRPLWQPLFLQTLPRGSAVARAIEPAARPATRETPRRAPNFPQCRKQNVGIVRIESHVDAARVFILVQNFF